MHHALPRHEHPAPQNLSSEKAREQARRELLVYPLTYSDRDRLTPWRIAQSDNQVLRLDAPTFGMEGPA